MCVLQSLQSRCSKTPVFPPAYRPLLSFTARSEFVSVGVARSLVRAPALPLALAPAVRFSVRRVVPEPFREPAAPSLRAWPLFSVLPSVSYAPLPRHGAPLMDFRSLQHLQVLRVRPFHERSLLATFRPQGLVTLSTACSLQNRVGRVSDRQRSWDSPFGAFSANTAEDAFPRLHPSHIPFLPRVSRHLLQRRPAAEARGFWGVSLLASLARRCVISASTAPDAPLSLALPGFSHDDLTGVSPGTPLTRFTGKNR